MAGSDGLEGVDAALARARAEHERRSERQVVSSAPTKVELESLMPGEQQAVMTVWRHIRRRLPTVALVVLLGGGAGYGGRKAQDAALSAELEASRAEEAKLRRGQRDADARIEDLERGLSVERDASKKLAESVAAQKVQLEKLEAAQTVVIRAAPDRPPVQP